MDSEGPPRLPPEQDPSRAHGGGSDGGDDQKRRHVGPQDQARGRHGPDALARLSLRRLLRGDRRRSGGVAADLRSDRRRARRSGFLKLLRAESTPATT